MSGTADLQHLGDVDEGVRRDAALQSKSQPAEPSAENIRAPHSASPPPLRFAHNSHSRKKPSDHIPRPRNAFILFRSDFVAQKRVPGSVERNHQNISKIAGAVWKALPSSDKEVWYARAEQEKEEHRRAYPGWRYNPAPAGAGLGITDDEAGTEPKLSLGLRGKRRRKVTKGRGAEELQACELKCKYVAGLVVGGQASDALEEALRDRDFKHEAKKIYSGATDMLSHVVIKSDVSRKWSREPGSSPSSYSFKESDSSDTIFPTPDPKLHSVLSRPTVSAYSPNARPISLFTLLRPGPPPNRGRKEMFAHSGKSSDALSKPRAISYTGLPAELTLDKAIPYATTRSYERRPGMSDTRNITPEPSARFFNPEISYTGGVEIDRRRISDHQFASRTDLDAYFRHPKHKRDEDDEGVEDADTRSRSSYACSYTRSQSQNKDNASDCDYDSSSSLSASDVSDRDYRYENAKGHRRDDYYRCRSGCQRTSSSDKVKRTRTRSPSPVFSPIPIDRVQQTMHRNQPRSSRRSVGSTTQIRAQTVQRSPSPDLSTPHPSYAASKSFAAEQPLPYKVRSVTGEVVLASGGRPRTGADRASGTWGLKRA